MNLYDKIEEIRRKPEHIRMRYVWSCVVISMVFVLTIWVLSSKSQIYQSRIESLGEVAGQDSIFDELKAQQESTEQYQQQISDIKANIQTEMQNIQSQQNIYNQSNIQSGEGFSGGINTQNALPASSSANLLQ